MTCTRCDATGFINFEAIADLLPWSDLSQVDHYDIREWISQNPDLAGEASICDCCGNGDEWYGEPGYHYHHDDPMGKDGPYAYNGGFCECH